MSLSSEEQILLQEYQEAGRVCQNHDQLTRTGLQIFSGIHAAIIAFIATNPASSFKILLLEFLGLWLSIVACATILRLDYRYQYYMERAKKIENRLGMFLYNYCSDNFDQNKKNIPLQWLPKQLRGNKKLLASIPVTTFIIYLILIMRHLFM